MKVLRESPEFKELDKELKEYLAKKEALFFPEPTLPPAKDAIDFTHLKDKGTEKVIERLLSSKERISLAKPLEENLLLGIRGPLAARKILERPNPPQVSVKVEAEIELTLYVLPNGIVDRVIPSVKGDSELERIAIQYLKQWRFAPLPRDQPQVEQWGTVPIKFKLQ
jgi:TonB family protein